MQHRLGKQIQEAMNRHAMQKILYLAVDWLDRLYGKRQEARGQGDQEACLPLVPEDDHADCAV